MKKVILYPSGDSYVVEASKNDNFSRFCKLEIQHSENKYRCSDKNSLIKFKLDKCIKNKRIIEARLYFHVSKLWLAQGIRYSVIDLNLNKEDFYYRNTTWSTAPRYYETNNNFIVNEKDIGKYVSVDIKDIVEYWIHCESNNNGVTLSTNYGSLISLSSSRSRNIPYLYIEYEDNCCNEGGDCPNGMNKSLNMLQLQLQDSESKLILSKEPVLFNKLIADTTKGVSYDYSTGTLKLSKLGLYYINWWVGIAGYENTDELAFAIEDEFKVIQIVGSTTLATTGQVNGSAVIEVKDMPLSIRCINFTSGTIQNSIRTTVQANLVMLQSLK